MAFRKGALGVERFVGDCSNIFVGGRTCVCFVGVVVLEFISNSLYFSVY
jgi:hypothetical protein